MGAYIEGVIEDMAQASTLAGGVATLMLADLSRAVTLLDAASTDARAVHVGLYVADASIVPTAIGNNPLLTIAALAERIADLIVTDPDHATLFEVPPTRHDPPMQSL